MLHYLKYNSHAVFQDSFKSKKQQQKQRKSCLLKSRRKREKWVPIRFKERSSEGATEKQRFKDRERFKKREKRGDTCWRKDAHVICLLHFQPAVRKDIPTGPLIHVNYHNSSLRNHSGMWFINDVDFFLKRNVIGAFFVFLQK